MALLLTLILPLLFDPFPMPGTNKIADFRLNDLSGKSVRYAEVKGKKVTVLDFWATWCKPCTQAIPKLVQLQARYRDQGVQILGINVDGVRNLNKVRPMASSLEISYPVLLDVNSQVRADLKVTAMPTILLVNENDEIVVRQQGYRAGDEKILEEEIRKLLQLGPADEK